MKSLARCWCLEAGGPFMDGNRGFVLFPSLTFMSIYRYALSCVRYRENAFLLVIKPCLMVVG